VQFVNLLTRSLNALHWRVHAFYFYLFHRWRLKSFGKGSCIVPPYWFTPENLRIGKKVIIQRACRIEAVRRYNSINFSPSIEFCDGVTIQQNLHLTCATKIYIGENTAVAANVTITDINHPYTDITIAVEHADIESKPVRIGRDCKIYNNSVILPGVTIGNHVVIGANSIVTNDIPDYCVAVGAPAKIIKKYDFGSKKWVRT